MAEIKIEKKSPIWPWILLGAIIVGVLIYVFASGNDDDNMRDDHMDNTEHRMNDRNRGNPRQPMNSLPDTQDGKVTLLNILNGDTDQIALSWVVSLHQAYRFC